MLYFYLRKQQTYKLLDLGVWQTFLKCKKENLSFQWKELTFVANDRLQVFNLKYELYKICI